MQTSSYAKQLSTIHRLTAPAIRSAIRDLPFASGDRVLDVGCGVGRHGLWLAEAVGRSGMVVGLDLSTEHLSAATNLVRGNPPPSRTTFVAGDLHALPFVDGAFDWIWCVDTLWPAFVAQEPVNAVSAFSRVVTNG
jgi:ubiquinone/menaquinone biosynthesis C-methylase UbiE